MAYINAEQTKVKRNALKAAFPGWKFSVRCDNHSSLEVRIIAADIDFFADDATLGDLTDRLRGHSNIGVNHYYLDSQWQGKALAALRKIVDICQEGNHDNSDISTDYFDVGWYLHIQIGAWDKPFQLRKEQV